MLINIPKISVLVPAYNSEAFIADCIDSILNQTYSNYELIIVNDASSDSTLKVIESTIDKFKSQKHKVKIINLKFNKGVSVARNIALQNCTGEYVLFIDSDDQLSNRDSIKKLSERLKNEKFDIVLGSFYFKSIINSKRSGFNFVTKSDYIEDLIIGRCPCSVCGKLIRKKLFFENNLRMINGLNFAEDFVISLQLAYVAEKIMYVNDVIYTYKRRLCNSLSCVDGLTIYYSYTRLNNYLLDYFKNEPSIQNLLKIRTKLLIMKHVTSMNFLSETESIYSNIEMVSSLNTLDKFILFLSKIKAFKTILLLQYINGLQKHIKLFLAEKMRFIRFRDGCL